MNDSITTRSKGCASPELKTGCPCLKLQIPKHKPNQSGREPPIHSINLGFMPAKDDKDLIHNKSKCNHCGCRFCMNRVPSIENHLSDNAAFGIESSCTCMLLELDSHYTTSRVQPSDIHSSIMNESKRTKSDSKGGGLYCYFYCSKFLLFMLCLLLAGGSVRGSEFPGRECCDSVPPPPPNYHHAISTTTSTTPAPNSNISSVTHYGESSQVNCIQARKQCFGEPRCREALGIFKKVCGPELAACTTVTRSKCRRVLRTLQKYDYLVDCRCGEPHMDFACYTFRDMIFSHPCDSVNSHEQESLIGLPACDRAQKQCRTDPGCLKVYMDFIKNCKFTSDGTQCEAHDNDREKCHKTWAKIRQSNIFGCICSPEPKSEALGQSVYYESPSYRPKENRLSEIRDMTMSDHDSDECMKIFNETHRNPCLNKSSDLLPHSSESSQIAFISPLYRSLEFTYKPFDLKIIVRGTVLSNKSYFTFIPMPPSGYLLWFESSSIQSSEFPPKGRADEMQIEEVQQTCHNALKSCQNDDLECQPLLSDVMMWCEHTHCEPDQCRAALQNFYSRVGIRRRLEVAFCVCRQNDPDGECLTAMRKLHPTCAQRQAGREEKKCHEIAIHCRKNRNCRSRLEEYERNCSTDEMTQKCSGTHRNCQVAVTKILGTELHASCVCKGTDFLHQRDCYTWQKLLWSNACVIESHLALQEELRRGEVLDDYFPKAPLSTTTPTPPRVPSTASMQRPYDPYGTGYHLNGQGPSMAGPRGSPGSVFGSINKGPGAGVKSSFGSRGSGVLKMGCAPGDPQCRRSHGGWGSGRNNGIQVGRERGRERGEQTDGESPTRNGGTVFGDRGNRKLGIPRVEGGLMSGGRSRVKGSHRGTGVPMTPSGTGGHVWYNGQRKMSPTYGIPHPGNLNPSRTPLYPRPNYNPNPPTQYKPNEKFKGDFEISTQETTSTTSPPKYCALQGTSEDKEVEDIKIPEGDWKRIYKKEGCSSLCKCPQSLPNQELLQAVCFTLGCIPHKGCNTSMAHYPHSSPYYQAYRGECMCYYGNFICQRPDPNKYTLGPGIYLFLAYSKHEMELLKHRTRANELEALVEIEKLLVKNYGFKCKLITKEHIGENLILVAELRVDEDSYISPYVKQRKEKEECKQPLQELTEKINAWPRHPEVSEDAYLSMFILAELHVNLPKARISPSGDASPLKPSFLLIIFMSIGLLLLICEEGAPEGGLHNLDIFSRRIRQAAAAAAAAAGTAAGEEAISHALPRRMFYSSENVADFT